MGKINVVGNNVLIKSIGTKKEGIIIIPGKDEEKSQYNFEDIIWGKGDKVPAYIKIGSTPIMSKFANPLYIEEHEKDTKTKIFFMIADYGDIIAWKEKK